MVEEWEKEFLDVLSGYDGGTNIGGGSDDELLVMVKALISQAKAEGREEVIKIIKDAHYISLDFEGHKEELRGETVLAWKNGEAIKRLWMDS